MPYFNLYGYSIEATDSMVKEAILLSHAHKQASELSDLFLLEYDKCSSLKVAVHRTEDIKEILYLSAGEYYVKLLRKHPSYGYSYSAKDFYHDFCRNRDTQFDEIYSVLVNAYNQLLEEKEYANAYRDARKASRGRMIGGGFGINGAITGALTAGAFNMLSGILHSGYNLADKAVTNASIGKKMEEVYDIAKKPLEKAIYMDIFDMVFFFLDLIDHEMIFRHGPKAIKIMKAVDDGEVPASEIPCEAARVLEYYPYSDKSYLWAMNLLGNSNGELLNYAKYYHRDNILEALKGHK